MNIIQLIIDFFNHPVFIIVGGLTLVFAAIGIIYRVVCIALGVTPLVFRIGKAIWRRKVAIIGSSEAFSSLTDCITDTNIFKRNNVIHIPTDNIEKVKEYTILLVDWETSGNQIEQIFIARKNHNTAVIIFAKAGSIPHEKMAEIANRSNTVVVNFKGRLVNDILNSLITTSFDGQ
jgi:5S rRNA maturation endonuclease (ribonuclease M5)